MMREQLFSNLRTNLRVAAMLSMLPFLSACQEMKQGEYGVVYTDMPSFLGGGVQSKLVEPGEREIVFPWETLYRFDTTLKSISWASETYDGKPRIADYVETRSLDGNEVDLALTIQYHIDPSALPHVVQRVGTDEKVIQRLVAAVSRASIRNFMNELHTRDFFSPPRMQAAVDRVREALNRRLSPEGIVIVDVIYNDHRFERRLPDGSVDRSYQEQIDRTQAINQSTEREVKRIATVEKDKEREYNENQAKVNRVREAAEGYKRQATIDGDSYLASKKNEAQQIALLGNAEVQGLVKQIEALSGPGGAALLRLAIVREMLKANPRFLLINSGNGQGNLDLNKVDMNELIRQADLFAIAPELNKETTGRGDSEQKVRTPLPVDNFAVDTAQSRDAAEAVEKAKESSAK